MDRLSNALNQRIYLVKIEYVSGCSQLIFHVLGTKNYIYKVVYSTSMYPKCSCPDSIYRKVTCKHIFFIQEKVLNKSVKSKSNNLEDMYNNIIKLLPHLKVYSKSIDVEYTKYLNVSEKIENVQSRNDECCICFERFDVSSGVLVICGECKNAIHEDCWRMYKSVNSNKSKNCVYCRTMISGDGSGVVKDCVGNIKF